MTLLTMGLVGCGSEMPESPSNPSSNSSTSNDNVFGQRTFSNLRPEAVSFADYNVTATGTLQIVANWASDNNDIDIFVTRTSCNATTYGDLLLASTGCNNVGQSLGVNRPERLSQTVSSGTYRIFVASSFLSRSAENGTLDVTFVR
jgi:uncharacterized protein YfaP (DUF2135 family)